MDLKRKVRGIPLILIIAVAGLLTVGAIAGGGGWFFNQIAPDDPPVGDLTDYTITITELIEFIQLDAIITGTGEIGTEHTIEYTITNVGTTYTLTSGVYQMGFIPLPENGDPAEANIDDQPIGVLAPAGVYTGSHTWTPATVSDYKCFFNAFNLMWETT